MTFVTEINLCFKDCVGRQTVDQMSNVTHYMRLFYGHFNNLLDLSFVEKTIGLSIMSFQMTSSRMLLKDTVGFNQHYDFAHVIIPHIAIKNFRTTIYFLFCALKVNISWNYNLLGGYNIKFISCQSFKFRFKLYVDESVRASNFIRNFATITAVNAVGKN